MAFAPAGYSGMPLPETFGTKDGQAVTGIRGGPNLVVRKELRPVVGDERRGGAKEVRRA
jgi:hypothetical protein